MGVCHKRKLCFVHIPKTAGVAIAKALNLTEVKHRPASFWRENYPDYALFTVVREYRERIDSAERYIKKHSKEDSPMYWHTTEYWIDADCDYHLSFKHVERDLNNMLKDMGHEPVKLERHNE